MPGDRAVDELVLVCQPDEAGCRPTRVSVDVCELATDAGCEVRSGLHDFLSDLAAYDDYVARLRGDPSPSEPAEADPR